MDHHFDSSHEPASITRFAMVLTDRVWHDFYSPARHSASYGQVPKEDRVQVLMEMSEVLEQESKWHELDMTKEDVQNS